MIAKNQRPLDRDRLRFVLPRASTGARIGAFVIDLVLFGMIGMVLSRLDIPGFVERLLWVSYLVGGHLKYGQTLGKRLCGIRVISTEGELTRSQLVMRETLYRTLSFFTLGFLRAFIARDGDAFHDLLSKTRVVSVEARAPGEEMAPALKAAIIFGCLVAFIAGSAFTILYTSLPLKHYAQQLELRGVRLEGVHGSIMSGIGVDRVNYQHEQGLVSLSGLSFAMDMKALFAEGKFRIKTMGVSEGRVSLMLSDLKKTPLPVPAGGESKEKPQKAFELAIDNIDISDFTVEILDQKKSYHLARFFLSDLKLSASKIAIGRIFIESDFLNLDVPNLQLNKGLLAVGSSRAVVKAKILPEGFKRDLDVQAKFEVDIPKKEVRSLSLFSLERRLQASAAAGKDGGAPSAIEISISNLNLSDYYPIDAPVYNLSAKARYPLAAASPLQLDSASFFFRSFKFQSADKSGVFRCARGDGRVFAVGINPAAIDALVGKSSAKAPPFMIGPGAPVAEWLSELYYGRPFARLAPTQQAVIDLDQAHFALPAVAAPAVRAPAEAAAAGAARTH